MEFASKGRSITVNMKNKATQETRSCKIIMPIRTANRVRGEGFNSELISCVVMALRKIKKN